jgi:hypothetical protein
MQLYCQNTIRPKKDTKLCLRRTKEIRRCFIFLNPVKNSMFTRAIFIRPDSELIWESVCAYAKLFVDEESTWHKSNRGRTNTVLVDLENLVPREIGSRD